MDSKGLSFTRKLTTLLSLRCEAHGRHVASSSNRRATILNCETNRGRLQMPADYEGRRLLRNETDSPYDCVALLLFVRHINF